MNDLHSVTEPGIFIFFGGAIAQEIWETQWGSSGEAPVGLRRRSPPQTESVCRLVLADGDCRNDHSLTSPHDSPAVIFTSLFHNGG